MDVRLQGHLDQGAAVAGVGDLEHRADVHPADPHLGLRHQPVGAGEIRVESELVAPGPVQAHVQGDEAQPAKAGRGEDDHDRDADENPTRHPQPPVKHWLAQKTRHMCTHEWESLPASSGWPTPLITEASSMNSCLMPGVSCCTTAKVVAAPPR